MGHVGHRGGELDRSLMYSIEPVERSRTRVVGLVVTSPLPGGVGVPRPRPRAGAAAMVGIWFMCWI